MLIFVQVYRTVDKSLYHYKVLNDLRLLMKTASGDLASDEVVLMTSALQEHFVFRTSFLQMLPSC